MPRTGRPPLDNPRTVVQRVRLTPDEDASIRGAAERAGMTVADWMRAKLLAAAKRSK